MSVVDFYPEHIVTDLSKSGLEPSDIRTRPLGPNEKHATNTPTSVDGYVIPYLSMEGKPLPFYRARLYEWDPKYKQVANQPNHIYFPPGFWQVANTRDTKCIILVEGEKKAACAVKHGYAACAVSGVDSWRNRIISMPKDTALVQGKNNTVVAKLAAGSELTERTDSLAVGMLELINLLIAKSIPLVIVYDSDDKGRIKPDVQAAAAILGYELRHRGVPAKHIRQLVLQPTKAYEEDKLGLDDFLVHPKLGPKLFAEQLQEVLDAKSAFPKHPNPKAYVNKKLQRSRMPRSDMQALSTAVLCDLDSRGSRLRCPADDRLYYFHSLTHELIPVHFMLNKGFANSPFGVKLYRDYNLGSADYRILQWLETQFTGEEPIAEVDPERVVTVRGDALYYQLSGGKMLKITADSVFLQDNGSDDILFEAGACEDLDKVKVMAALGEAQKLSDPLPSYWYEVLKEARVKDTEDDRTRKILALLYSISPWFYRWRGTQLPIEMMIAEPGSGKSTMYQLRLDVLTGIPSLRNAPRDMRDWTASVAHTGGLHVTDNVNMSNSQLRQELSDELCRIVTEPNPHIEARKLYSDNELVRTPVKAVFALTAVKQPFNNPDIIQRSIITVLDKGDEEVEYEAGWEQRQLNRFGGREGWIAFQVVFLQRLLRKIRDKWDHGYRAKFRLINIEQLLMLAAEVYGWDPSWIPDHLEATKNKSISEADWALEGLKAFADDARAQGFENDGSRRYSAQDISAFFEGDEEFGGCSILVNSRQLGKYLTQNRNMISTIVGISEKGGKYANKTMYWVHTPRQ
jgi:hypothetical protein